MTQKFTVKQIEIAVKLSVDLLALADEIRADQEGKVPSHVYATRMIDLFEGAREAIRKDRLNDTVDKVLEDLFKPRSAK